MPKSKSCVRRSEACGRGTELSLSPSLRGRDERSSLLEGRGEGLSPRVVCWLMDLYPLTRIARDACNSDLSPQAGRGKAERPHPEEARSAVSKDEGPALTIAPTRTAHGLLLRSVPDRPRQRGVAVPGRVGAVDHLRRDADRELCPWRVLHARRLCRVHADRALLRRVRLLGRHRRCGAGRRRRRRAGRDGAAAADLPCAGTVPVARDLRPDADGPGYRGADLGTGRSARPPRARLQGRGRFLRPEHPEL